jgi:hypothetical protein
MVIAKQVERLREEGNDRRDLDWARDQLLLFVFTVVYLNVR